MNSNLDYSAIKNIIGAKEDYQVPDVLRNNLLNQNKREEMFDEFLKLETDLSYDWFHTYFQQMQADRSGNKQDFTPDMLTKLVVMLAGNSSSTLDPAAGTGGITIASWNNNPDQYFHVEELMESTTPFLLFNCLVRNMDGVLINGDTLTRIANQVYVFKSGEHYSQLDVLPHTDEVAEAYDVSDWSQDEIDHIEYPEWEAELPQGDLNYSQPEEIALDI